MIKKICLLLLAAVFLLLDGAQGEAAEMNGQYRQHGRELTFAQVIMQLADKDVILFGEYHDNPRIHDEELRVWQELCADRPPALSMEMFERDVQGVLDAYLAAEISEAEFLHRSRPWPRYQTDYKPLVLAAGRLQRPVIAANIPRYLAAAYAKSGSLDSIAAEGRQYLPRRHETPQNAYYKAFMQYMLIGEMSAVMNEEKAMRYYQAQCLKDDTMAESIVDYLSLHTGEQVYHVQGAFHSRGMGGVAEKLLLLRPDLKLAVITSLYEDEVTAAEAQPSDEIYFVVKRQ